jgi:hypothetical protein
MLMMMSTSLARAAGEAMALAPLWINAASFSGLRFHTETFIEDSSKRSTMAAPIRPVPIHPICMIDSYRTMALRYVPMALGFWC